MYFLATLHILHTIFWPYFSHLTPLIRLVYTPYCSANNTETQTIAGAVRFSVSARRLKERFFVSKCDCEANRPLTI